MAWTVRLQSDAERGLDAFPAAIKRQALAAIVDMADDPYSVGGLPIENMPNGFKLKFGSWRVAFRVEGSIVKIFAAGHRARFYDHLPKRHNPK